MTIVYPETRKLSDKPDARAPDGSDVRVLLNLPRGGMAHFELAAGLISLAVTHKTVEEIWYILSGRGQIWRKQGGQESVTDVFPGLCITIPLGTHFQFRSLGDEPLAILGVTMPPWPLEGDALPVEGIWEPTVG
ncbi:hypothetical protein GCM10007874_24820 [Labrys miyagiensis]|uniref:Cupin type-2 domain-containing protein n=1 Tax=Labrys miyagiensis TaxID=346912 RepID=A0ABQ6CKR0_9HYPH|nr:cupin domain-containing protein [Labrys miyagiensis]GLS19465.1 hypothetical protein GCM10007874_24820 [Labrys miyagiensis]